MFKRFTAWLAKLFADDSQPPQVGTPAPAAVHRAGRTYVVRAEQDVPDAAAAGVLHLIEDDKGQHWLAVMGCPCGCGATIQLPMTPPARPCWQFRGTIQKPTLWPSVRRAAGCRSHFILRGGFVQWCRDP